MVILRFQKEIVILNTSTASLQSNPVPFWGGLAFVRLTAFTRPLGVAIIPRPSRCGLFYFSGCLNLDFLCYFSVIFCNLLFCPPTYALIEKRPRFSRDPLETLWRFIYVAALSKSAGGVFVLLNFTAQHVQPR